MSILDDESVQSAVVELRNPRQTGRNITYQVTVRDGKLPATGGVCSLFIDGLFYGAARGAAVGGTAGAMRTRREMAYQAGTREGEGVAFGLQPK